MASLHSGCFPNFLCVIITMTHLSKSKPLSHLLHRGPWILDFTRLWVSSMTFPDFYCHLWKKYKFRELRVFTLTLMDFLATPQLSSCISISHWRLVPWWHPQHVANSPTLSPPGAASSLSWYNYLAHRPRMITAMVFNMVLSWAAFYCSATQNDYLQNHHVPRPQNIQAKNLVFNISRNLTKIRYPTTIRLFKLPATRLSSFHY